MSHRTAHACRALITAGSLIFTPLAAETPTPSAATPPPAAPESPQSGLSDLDTVVVTGTRTERTVATAPVRTEVFPAAEIEALGGVTLADSLRLVPSVRFESECANCGLNQIQMLGLGTDYTAILFDGAPLYSGLARVYGADFFPTIFIDRIEVVKGSSSVLYGPEAIAGVVNLVSDVPRENVARLKAGTEWLAEEAQGYDLSFRFSHLTESARSAATAYGLFQDREGLDLSGDGFSELPEFRNAVAGLQLHHRPVAEGTLRFNYQYLDEAHRGGDQLWLPEEESRVAESLAHQIHTAGLGWTHQPDPDFSYALKGAYTYIHRDAFYGARSDAEYAAYTEAGNPPFADPDNPTVAEQADYDAYRANPANQQAINDVARRVWSEARNQVAFADASINRKFSDHELIVGAQGRNENLQEERPNDPAIADTADSFATYGVFAQDIWSVSPNFEVVPGVRADQHDNVSGTIISPRLALRYLPLESLTVRASYASGFNAPGAYNEDLHIGVSSGGAIFLRNDPDLQEEHADCFTLGLEWYPAAFERNLGLSSTAYLTFLEGTFDIDDSDPTEWLRINGPDSEVFVWENGINYLFTPALKLEASVSYTDARYDEAVERVTGLTTDRYIERPEWTGQATLTYSHDAWSAYAAAHYTGTMLATGEDADIWRWTPTFLEIDLGLSYGFSLGSRGTELRLGLGVRNLFDDRQDDLQNNGEDRDPTYFYGPTRPRTLFANVELRF